MNIVIRTAILKPSLGDDKWEMTIGAGGAITSLSESNDEYEEMLLKASTVLGAVETWAGGKQNSELVTSSPCTGENRTTTINLVS